MKSGIFNETFDTVLFKPQERESRLVRFASELVYCLLHDEQICLAEPHAADQALLIRLFESARSTGAYPELAELRSWFRIVQKPVFRDGRMVGSAFFPVSVARNLLNPAYDWSSLSPDLELHRRNLTGAIEALRKVRRTPARSDQEAWSDATTLLLELQQAPVSHAAEDGNVLDYLARLLWEAGKFLRRPEVEWAPAWNALNFHGFPELAHPFKPDDVTPSAALRGPGPMGAIVGQALANHTVQRPGLVRISERMPELTSGMKIPAGVTPLAHYFSTRSHFYLARPLWEETIKADEFKFLKEVVDTAYNLVIAHSCGARHNMFLPSQANDKDYVDGQRAVMEIAGGTVATDSMGLVFAKQQETMSWQAFLGLVRGLGEAARQPAFIQARSEYANMLGKKERLEKLHALALMINQTIPSNLMVVTLDNLSIVLHIKGEAGEVASVATHPVVSAGTQGELGLNPNPAAP